MDSRAGAAIRPRLERDSLSGCRGTYRFAEHDLNWLCGDDVVSHLSTIQDCCGGFHHRFVLDFNIAKCRTDSGFQIENDSRIHRRNTARFYPVPKLPVGAIVWKVGEKYFSH